MSAVVPVQSAIVTVQSPDGRAFSGVTPVLRELGIAGYKRFVITLVDENEAPLKVYQERCWGARIEGRP